MGSGEWPGRVLAGAAATVAATAAHAAHWAPVRAVVSKIELSRGSWTATTSAALAPERERLSTRHGTDECSSSAARNWPTYPWS